MSNHVGARLCHFGYDSLGLCPGPAVGKSGLAAGLRKRETKVRLTCAPLAVAADPSPLLVGLSYHSRQRLRSRLLAFLTSLGQKPFI